MSMFSLLSGLDRDAKAAAALDPNAPSITYQQYDIPVSGEETCVLIPERECNNFENAVIEAGELSQIKLKKLVREHRGIFSQ
jgi:hypothetical protein